jgi:hypothetical protein
MGTKWVRSIARCARDGVGECGRALLNGSNGNYTRDNDGRCVLVKNRKDDSPSIYARLPSQFAIR